MLAYEPLRLSHTFHGIAVYLNRE